jgi:hypothetical protein
MVARERATLVLLYMASAHPGWIELSKWLKEHGMKACLVEGRATPGAGYGLFAAQDVEVSTYLGLHDPAETKMSQIDIQNPPPHSVEGYDVY